MDLKAFLNILTEIIYILCGLVSISVAIRGLKNEKARVGTFLFYLLHLSYFKCKIYNINSKLRRNIYEFTDTYRYRYYRCRFLSET